MSRTYTAPALRIALAVLSLVGLATCGGGFSSLARPGCCAAYQQSASLPSLPPPGVFRLAVGGDSRNDSLHVAPWAFAEARRRGAQAFVFLGDMELFRVADGHFKSELAGLAGIPFYPVIGNHELTTIGPFVLPGRRHAVKEFREDFLTSPAIRTAGLDEVAYSVDLGGVVHLVALDNVSVTGFGTRQLGWLAADLAAARAAKKTILVAMHKPLANNPVTLHAMDADGPDAVSDSDSALALFGQHGVAMVFVSHSHMYAAYTQTANHQRAVEVRLTGGLGAPLVKGLSAADGGFHHFLIIDIPLGHEQTTALTVEVVRFPGGKDQDTRDEADEKED